MAKGKIWTSEEDEFLIEKWGNSSVKYISKKLKRSVKAVKIRAFRLDLGEFHSAGDLLMVKDLIIALGYSYVEQVIDKFVMNDFPIKYIEYHKKRYRKVSIEDFWKWAEKNKDVVNFAFFEKNMLGKEPSWVDEKRKIDKANYTNRKVLWTKDQERLLVAKARTGKYTLDQLALEFNRTEQAVRRKLFDLGEPILYKARSKNRYTPEEEQIILDMRAKGFDFTIIARELNRSETGIKDKYNRLVS